MESMEPSESGPGFAKATSGEPPAGKQDPGGLRRDRYGRVVRAVGAVLPVEDWAWLRDRVPVRWPSVSEGVRALVREARTREGAAAEV